MPVRKDDEVMVMRGLLNWNLHFHPFIGPYAGNKGKVTCVYRRRWYINIEKLSKPKMNGNHYIKQD